jgi:hypothetical protein
MASYTKIAVQPTIEQRTSVNLNTQSIKAKFFIIRILPDSQTRRVCVGTNDSKAVLYGFSACAPGDYGACIHNKT